MYATTLLFLVKIHNQLRVAGEEKNDSRAHTLMLTWEQGWLNTVHAVSSFSLPPNRGEAHFLLKWPGEKKQAYLNILHPEIPISYTNEDSGTWKTILSMECRGLEPSRWKPRADFTVTSLGGKVFDSVDLSENDWSDYDEENSLAVTILDLEYKIEREK